MKRCKNHSLQLHRRHEESLRGKNKYATALEEEEAINQQLHSYLDFHAGNILAHDKKGILGGVSIYDTVAEPYSLPTRRKVGCLATTAIKSFVSLA